MLPQFSKERCIGCGDVLTKYHRASSNYGHGEICTICAMTEAFYGDFITDYIGQCDSYQFPFQIMPMGRIEKK
jgi:hypothetical protein